MVCFHVYICVIFCRDPNQTLHILLFFSNYGLWTNINIKLTEICHAFSAKSSGLLSSGEAGGIAEAFSDCIGEVTEFYYKGLNDWAVGSDSWRGNGAADRYMNDPPYDGISIDNYSSYTSATNPYESSGIYSKAIYLLNTMYRWSMKELFVVFIKTNQLYWTEKYWF